MDTLRGFLRAAHKRPRLRYRNHWNLTRSGLRWSSLATQHRHPPRGTTLVSSVAQRLLASARRFQSFSSAPNKNFELPNLLQPPRLNRAVSGSAQFTNRRSRTLFTSPNIKNVDNVFEPPALISGSGMPTTGILPITIPTFTNK